MCCSRDFQRRDHAGDDRREECEPRRIFRVVAESPPSIQNGQGSASVVVAASAHFNARSVAVKPSTAAMAASTSASANSCITIRLRAAPRARRTRIFPLTRRGSSKHQQRDVAADHHEKQRAEGVDRMTAARTRKSGGISTNDSAYGSTRGCRFWYCFGSCSATRDPRSSTPPEPPGARCRSPDGRRRASRPRPGPAAARACGAASRGFAGQGTRILPA